ncbi:MAG TPA: hypothetical protein VJH97_04140 [Candidatus Nanoarchaeia archaeon]|nr:hypothetical protein [Candidatus Nanoarchaeia archaeon]
MSDDTIQHELDFLKESLESGIITQEEFESAVAKIKAPDTDTEVDEPTQEHEASSGDRDEPTNVDTKPVQTNRKALYIIAAIILIFFIVIVATRQQPEPVQFAAACTLDTDCVQQGKLGRCANPGSQDAVCQFIDPVTVEISLINDARCVSCDTNRMLGVLQQLFGEINVRELDAANAGTVLEDLDIEVLPAYLLSSSIENSSNFERFRRALIKKGDDYLITPAASGASYFYARPEHKSELIAFVLPEDVEKVSQNVQPVLDLFKESIDYRFIIVNDSVANQLKEEFALTSYPTFLVNNRFKFGGIHSPESIKDKFCEFNEDTGCLIQLALDIS